MSANPRMDTPESDREDDYSIANGLNISLLCNEDTFVDAYVISSESDIDNEIGNEAEASCLLTCCDVNANNCNVNHVVIGGLGSKAAAPCLSMCCEKSIVISNKINHVFVDAPVNEVTNKPKLAQASFIDKQIVNDVNTLPIAEVEPGVAVGEVQMRAEERRPVQLSSVEVALSGGIASFAKRYVDCACVAQTPIAAAPPEAALVAERCDIRVESLVDPRGVIILKDASWKIDNVKIDTVDIDSVEIDNVKADNLEVDHVEIVAVEGMLPDVAFMEIENVKIPTVEITTVDTASVKRLHSAVGAVEVVPVKGMPPDVVSVEIVTVEIENVEFPTAGIAIMERLHAEIAIAERLHTEIA